MTEIAYRLRAGPARRGLAYYLRVLRVVGPIQFKAKYAGAALGYVWSLVKPLSYFAVIWLVFAYLLRTSNQTSDFALYLLIGILLYTFFTDSTTVMLPSIADGRCSVALLSGRFSCRFPPSSRGSASRS